MIRVAQSNQRFHGLDILRAFALLLGLVFHAALPFLVNHDGLEWIVYDRENSWLFNIIAETIHAFRMPLFFILAGFFSALLLVKNGLNKFIKLRFKKLVIPFALSMIILTPIMIYQYSLQGFRAKSHDINAMFIFLSYPVFHLWFLEVLIIITSIFCSLIFIQTIFFSNNTTLNSLFLQRLERSKYLFYTTLIIIVLLLLFCVWSTMPGDQFVSSYAIAQSFDKILFYFIFFLIGWALYQDANLLKIVQINYKINILIGTVAVLVLCFVRFWIFENKLSEPNTAIIIGNIAAVLSATNLSLGLFGMFTRDYFKASKIVDYLVAASYWIYLVHLPIMFFIQVHINNSNIPIEIKYIITIGTTFVLCCASYSSLVILKTKLSK